MTTKVITLLFGLIFSLAIVSGSMFVDSASIGFNADNNPTEAMYDSQSRQIAMTNQDGSVTRSQSKESTCPAFSEIDGHKDIRVQNIILRDSDAPNIDKAATLSKDLNSVVAWYMYGGCADDRLQIKASNGQTYSDSNSQALFSQINYQGDSGTSCKNVPQAELPVNILSSLKSKLNVKTTQSNWVTLASYAQSDNADKHNLQVYSCIYTSCDYDADGKKSQQCGGTDDNDFVAIDNTKDITPPGTVKDLLMFSKGYDQITWFWKNPTDSDFSHVIVTIDGKLAGNTSSTKYQITGLSPGTTHTISLKTVDKSGNINNNAVSHTEKTLSSTDFDHTAPVIFVTNTNPTFPFVNNGSEQKVIVKFASNEYPVTSVFKLYNSNGTLLETQGPVTKNAGEDNVPVEFIISDSLLNGQYKLELWGSDKYGNTAKVSLGFFTVNQDNNNNPPGNETDTTPPGPVTDLTLTKKSKTFLEFSWKNPADSDFSKVLVYFNGSLVSDTSGSTYEATDLQANTEYTITLKTQDKSGNINENGVSLTVKTDETGGSNGNPKDKKKPVREAKDLGLDLPVSAPGVEDNSFETIVLSGPAKKQLNSGYLLIALIALSLLLIIILLVLAFSLRR